MAEHRNGSWNKPSAASSLPKAIPTIMYPTDFQKGGLITRVQIMCGPFIRSKKPEDATKHDVRKPIADIKQWLKENRLHIPEESKWAKRINEARKGGTKGLLGFLCSLEDEVDFDKSDLEKLKYWHANYAQLPEV